MADLPDPSTLSDEELDKIINGEELPEEEEQPDSQDAPEEEEEAPDEEVVEEEEAPEVVEEETQDKPEEEEKPPSRREQLRIRQILAKSKQQPTSPKAPEPTGLNYEEELDTDSDTRKRLEDDRRAYAEEVRQATLREMHSSEWRTRLDIDAPQVASKHGFLNHNDKEKFKPEVADALNTWYLDMAGFDAETNTVTNPTIRYGEFVDGVVELAKEIAGNMVENTTKQIKTQAAKAGLRPDGSSSKKLNLNQAPESMTDEELDAIISQAIPPRR